MAERTKVIAARRAKGLKQEDVAHELGLNQSTVSRFENGDATLDAPRAAKLMDLLGVVLSDIVTPEEVASIQKTEAA